ncbi:MAG: Hsp70 family protein [Deltaproteobacteria bacterium]|nr:Hsp70 family protein [Deltaproteobacteria bacterium]
MTLAIGIDLGTTNSVAAVATPTGVEFALGAQGERIHPSVVAYPDGGGVLVGAAARPRRVNDPRNTIFSAKRLIGQNIRSPLVQLSLTTLPFVVEEGPNQQAIVVARDRRMTIPEISSQVLLHLKRATERQMADRVSQAVITVPANFTDAQRQATKEAGRLAGLEVLRLINEPTAAALAYGFGQRLDETVCVFDFGGGTFDVSLLKIRGEIFEVLATDGDFFLGGDDLDRAIAEVLAAEMNTVLRYDPRRNPTVMTRLAMAAEEIKFHLGEHTVAEGEIDGIDVGDGRTVALPFRLTRPQFDGLITGYVDRTIDLCRQVLTTARIQVGEVSEVLCVGGSTRIPLVRRRLAELFGREPAIRINPDEVIAQGAAIQAGTLSGNLAAGTGMGARDAVVTAATSPLFSGAGGVPFDPGQPLPRPLLLDVTPATLSIATAGGYTERLLEKNAPIPIERTKIFTTARDHQTQVVIDCCRGESRRFADNEPLGQLVLDDLPSRPRGEVRIEVTFRVDTDGILHVRARDAQTGVKQEAQLAVLGAPVAERAA